MKNLQVAVSLIFGFYFPILAQSDSIAMKATPDTPADTVHVQIADSIPLTQPDDSTIDVTDSSIQAINSRDTLSASPQDSILPDTLAKDTVKNRDTLKTTSRLDRLFPDSFPACAQIETGYLFNENQGEYTFTSEQIMRTDASTLGELFRLIPGISISRSTFWGGAEEIRWHGLHIQKVITIVDGVPYFTDDLGWQQLSKMAPMSFQEIRISQKAGQYGSGLLTVEMKTKRTGNERPVTDVLYHTGPFEQNLLDILFSRRLGPSLSFNLHSRMYSTISKNYHHPDVITTFYESFEDDTARITTSGFTPAQDFRNLRLGFQKPFGNRGILFFDYSAEQESNTLLLSNTVLQDSNDAGWRQNKSKSSFLGLGFQNLNFRKSVYNTVFYSKSNGEKSLSVSNRRTIFRQNLEVGINKKVTEFTREERDPLYLWASLSPSLPYLSLRGFFRGGFFPDSTQMTRYTYGEANLKTGPFFIENHGSYSISFPVAESTFLNNPITWNPPAVDTTVSFGVKTGVNLKGYSVWTKFSDVYTNMPNNIYLSRNDPVNADQTVSLGLNTYEKQNIQFGSAVHFSLHGTPDRIISSWILLHRSAMEEKLLYDGMIHANHIKGILLPDLNTKTWKAIAPFWDISLKLSIQIMRFRLYYKVHNILNAPVQYYEPYRLPGLLFLWGLRWNLYN